MGDCSNLRLPFALRSVRGQDQNWLKKRLLRMRLTNETGIRLILNWKAGCAIAYSSLLRRTMRISFFVLLVISSLSAQHSFTQSVPASVSAQQENERSREILASFNKTKHEVREKFGVRKEKYKDIHSESVIRLAIQDYAGSYRVPDLGYTIDIARSGAGVTITGSEPQGDSPSVRHFHLEAASLDGS